MDLFFFSPVVLCEVKHTVLLLLVAMPERTFFFVSLYPIRIKLSSPPPPPPEPIPSLGARNRLLWPIGALKEDIGERREIL